MTKMSFTLGATALMSTIVAIAQATPPPITPAPATHSVTSPAMPVVTTVTLADQPAKY
jgi:hypothetical protein